MVTVIAMKNAPYVIVYGVCDANIVSTRARFISSPSKEFQRLAVLSFGAVCIWLRVSEHKMGVEEGKIGNLMPDY